MGFGKKMKLKRGEVNIRLSSDLTAMKWNDKQNVNVANMYRVPDAEGIFSAMWKFLNQTQYNTQHIGYANKSYCTRHTSLTFE
jgi:hypothetical protein